MYEKEQLFIDSTLICERKFMTKIKITNKRSCLFVLLLLFVSGCDNAPKDAPDTIEVTGTVTLDGKDIPQGTIIFDPIDGIGGSSAGEIIDGKFKFQSQFGKKRVLISASRKTGEKDQYGGDVSEPYVPERYSDSSKSELKKTITDDQENKFTFDLKSK